MEISGWDKLMKKKIIVKVRENKAIILVKKKKSHLCSAFSGKIKVRILVGWKMSEEFDFWSEESLLLPQLQNA